MEIWTSLIYLSTSTNREINYVTKSCLKPHNCYTVVEAD